MRVESIYWVPRTQASATRPFDFPMKAQFSDLSYRELTARAIRKFQLPAFLKTADIGRRTPGLEDVLADFATFRRVRHCPKPWATRRRSWPCSGDFGTSGATARRVARLSGTAKSASPGGFRLSWTRGR